MGHANAVIANGQCACVFVCLAAVPGLAQEPILAPADKPTHRFEEVAEGVYFVSGTGEGIVVMESHHKDFAELEKSSVDFYPVLRSAFYQNRMGEIWDRRQHRKP